MRDQLPHGVTRAALLIRLRTRAVNGLFVGVLASVSDGLNRKTVLNVLGQLVRDGTIVVQQGATRHTPWRLVVGPVVVEAPVVPEPVPEPAAPRVALTIKVASIVRTGAVRTGAKPTVAIDHSALAVTEVRRVEVERVRLVARGRFPAPTGGFSMLGRTVRVG